MSEYWGFYKALTCIRGYPGILEGSLGGLGDCNVFRICEPVLQIQKTPLASRREEGLTQIGWRDAGVSALEITLEFD